MKTPSGLGLLFAGSGLYWVLAGPLIGWFSVFNPTQIRLSQLGLTLILVTGVACLATGLWFVPRDFERLHRLFSRYDGWVFTIPIVLVVSDIYLTLIGLSRGNWELNPYVYSAIQIGPWAVIPFLLSYLALSEGLALATLSIGRKSFGAHRSLEYLPFALVCGAGSVGAINNIELLIVPSAGPTNLIVAMIVGIIALSGGMLWHFRSIRARFVTPSF